MHTSSAAMSYQVLPSPAIHQNSWSRLGSIVHGPQACQVASSCAPSRPNLLTSFYGRQLTLSTRTPRRVRASPATSAEVSRDEMERVRQENAASYQAARRVMGMLTDTMDALQNGISKREKALAVTATEIDNIIAGGLNSPPRDNAEEERWKAESKILKLQARLAAMGKELEEKTRVIAALQKENSIIKERLAESLSRLMEMQKLKKEVEEREARLLALSKNITNGTQLQTALVEAEQRVMELNEQVSRLTVGIKERDMLLTSASIALPEPVPALKPRKKTVTPVLGISRGMTLDSSASGEEDKGTSWLLGAGMWITLVAVLFAFQLQVTDLETELTTATDARTALTQDVEVLLEKVKVAEEKRTASEARLGVELQTLAATQSKLVKVEKELSLLKEEKEGLLRQLNGVKGELASAQTQLMNLQRQVVSLGEEKAALYSQMSGLEGRLSASQELEAAEGMELAELKKKFEEKSALVAQLEAELLDTKDKVEFLREEKSVLGKRMEDRDAQSKELLVSAESLKQQLEEEKVKEAQLAKELEMAKMEEDSLKREAETKS